MSGTSAARRYYTLDVDAVAFLRRDHHQLEILFQRYRTCLSRRRRAAARRLLAALAIHIQLEAEIFFPALGDALAQDAEAADESCEHKLLERLLAAASTAPSAALDEVMRRLEHAFAQHVQSEETLAFAAIAAKQIDLIGIGAALVARRADLYRESLPLPGARDSPGRSRHRSNQLGGLGGFGQVSDVPGA
jgi:hemerythrin HHE cation binding domain-containing protein